MLIAAGSSRGNFVDITVPSWGWPMLLGVITVLLLVDILVFHRKAHVVTIDNVPHLNSWWRANAADIERMLPPHVDALKAVYAERRTAILDALRAQQAAVTGRPRRGQAAASAAH